MEVMVIASIIGMENHTSIMNAVSVTDATANTAAQ